MKLWLTTIIMIAGATQFVACNSGDTTIEKYSISDNWQTLPENNVSQPVDVFFVYPTTYFPNPNTNGHVYSAGWNQTMDQAKADSGIQTQVASKASVFYAAGTNLYAPYYQQVSGMDVLSALLWKTNPSNIEAATTGLEIAYHDVEKAFDYYMAHYNKDANNKPRPFILAGHSQGSNLLLMLLERRFSDAALRKQLVAAYIVGWSVTADDMSNYPALSQLGICSNKDQTGCIVTYNTQAHAGDFSQPTNPASPTPVGIVQANAYSVNPLTWVASNSNESESAVADSSKNLGALFYKFELPIRPQLGPTLDSQPERNTTVVSWDNYNIGGVDINAKKIVKYTGAQNKNGALVINPEDLLAPGNYQNLNYPYDMLPGWYHNYDYSFFFFNLQQNAIDRIASYNVSH